MFPSRRSHPPVAPSRAAPAPRTRTALGRLALRVGALAVLTVPLAACGDDPFLLRWQENPREAVLFSLDRPELNRPQAFDLLQARRVIVQSVEEEGRWDFAVDRVNGEMVFLPPRALGVSSQAALVPLPGTAFADVREAPADTAVYISREPVPIRQGTLYVVRTHQQTGPWGQRCFYYGKVEPLEIDDAQGTVRFLFDVSPDCNNRRLVPPGS
jgi:hypothetical protein